MTFKKSPLFNWRHNPGLGLLTHSLLAALYIPLAILVIYSFNGGRSASVWGGFSVRWFGAVLNDQAVQLAAMNSVIIAIGATIASTFIATMAGVGLSRAETGRLGAVINTVAMLPLVVPEIVTAITTLVFFSLLHLKLGLGNLIIAHTVFCIPLALLPIRARLREMGPVYADVARDLYADEWQIFRRVTLPLIAPAVLVGAMLAFVVSLDDFMISQMVSDAETTTLPVYIFGLMHQGVTPTVNALSTILLVISVTVLTLSMVVRKLSAKAT